MSTYLLIPLISILGFGSAIQCVPVLILFIPIIGFFVLVIVIVDGFWESCLFFFSFLCKYHVPLLQLKMSSVLLDNNMMLYKL